MPANVPQFNPLTGLMETPGLSDFVPGTITPSEFGILFIQVADADAALTLLGTDSGLVTSVGAAVAGGSAAALSVSGSPITTAGTFTFTVDPALVSIAGLATVADRMLYTTGVDTYALATLTSLARNLLDDTTTGAMQTTLALVIGTNVQAHSATLDSVVANVVFTGNDASFAGNIASDGTITAVLGMTSGGNLAMGGNDITGAGDITATGTIAATDLTADDITIVNSVVASDFIGGGGSLTDLNASALVSGTVPNARLDGDLQALAANITNGLWARTGSGSGSARTLTGTANKITVTDGDGVAGNPTVTIASGYVGQNTITTLGTVTTGQWNATAVPVAYGGTGASTAINGLRNLGVQKKYKASDTVRSSTTAPAADPDLTFSVDASEVWEFEFWITVLAASATPDLKGGISVPAGGTGLTWAMDYSDYDANTVTALTLLQSADTSQVVPLPASSFVAIRISGTIINGLTAGSVAFAWAQNSSSADTVTVYQGSKLVAVRAA